MRTLSNGLLFSDSDSIINYVLLMFAVIIYFLLCVRATRPYWVIMMIWYTNGASSVAAGMW